MVVTAVVISGSYTFTCCTYVTVFLTDVAGISPLPRRGARGGIDVGSFFGGSVLGAHGPHGVAVLGLCFAAAGLLPLLAEKLLSRLAAVRRPRGHADPCS